MFAKFLAPEIGGQFGDFRLGGRFLSILDSILSFVGVIKHIIGGLGKMRGMEGRSRTPEWKISGIRGVAGASSRSNRS